jgi:LysM repeat protein
MSGGYGDYPAADYPAGDYPAGDYATSGFASGEYPATWQDASEMAAVLPAAGGTYTVAAGDNLSRIAANYGISVDLLLQANGIQNPNIIYVGQQLILP